MKDDHREAVCPICNQTVAPYDSARLPLLSTTGEIRAVAHKDHWNRATYWLQSRVLEAVGADPATLERVH